MIYQQPVISAPIKQEEEFSNTSIGLVCSNRLQTAAKPVRSARRAMGGGIYDKQR